MRIKITIGSRHSFLLSLGKTSALEVMLLEYSQDLSTSKAGDWPFQSTLGHGLIWPQRTLPLTQQTGNGQQVYTLQAMSRYTPDVT